MSKKQKVESQASFIRPRLAMNASVETILAEAQKRFPQGKVTAGYIRWIGKKAKATKPVVEKAKAMRPAERTDGSTDAYLA